MDPIIKYALIALGVLIVFHQISFRLFWNPAKYKETVTLRAAHKAFKEDTRKLPLELVPYKWKIAWTRLFNLYQLKLHRNAPDSFKELRGVWNIDEDEYQSEVSCSSRVQLNRPLRRPPIDDGRMVVFRQCWFVRIDVLPFRAHTLPTQVSGTAV
jgi:hypothetical protein